jgi:protein-S-isoprenylcysteine O-methyltransferase Ste14
MSRSRQAEITELLGRAGIAIYFSFVAALKVMFIARLLTTSPTPDNWALLLLSNLSSLMFVCMVVILALFRLKPLCSAEGIEPRITAMVATYMMWPAVLIGGGPPSMSFAVAGSCLIAIGGALSAYVLVWLGRSFSIMADARRLVTGGPYAIVRHPLYVTEVPVMLGIALLNWSPIVVTAFVIHCCLQLRRMYNEEKVLRAAFPEYAAYAERTPRWFPMPSAWRQQPA